MSQIYECLTAFQSLCYASWAILRPAGFAFVLKELRLVKNAHCHGKLSWATWCCEFPIPRMERARRSGKPYLGFEEWVGVGENGVVGDSGYGPGETSDSRCWHWPVGCLPGIGSYCLLSCEALPRLCSFQHDWNVCLAFQNVGLKHFKWWFGVGWGRYWFSLGYAGGGDKLQHWLAHLSPAGLQLSGASPGDRLLEVLSVKPDHSSVLDFLWERAVKTLKLWAISQTSQAHSSGSPNNVGISMDINRAWGGWRYGGT